MMVAPPSIQVKALDQEALVRVTAQFRAMGEAYARVAIAVTTAARALQEGFQDAFRPQPEPDALQEALNHLEGAVRSTRRILDLRQERAAIVAESRAYVREHLRP